MEDQKASERCTLLMPRINGIDGLKPETIAKLFRGDLRPSFAMIALSYIPVAEFGIDASQSRCEQIRECVKSIIPWKPGTDVNAVEHLLGLARRGVIPSACVSVGCAFQFRDGEILVVGQTGFVLPADDTP